ncbi:MAG TPA: divergent PAP2 family protein [Candidatus Omnitrophota bacterium]|nr:divergent PAP2 family protein [Candidatus Omnitrophota bacterium]
MRNIARELITNKIFIVTLLSWVIAQTMKVIIGYIKEKKVDFRWFVGTGGMPSSHTAGATCLAVAIGFTHGFDSVLFALAASFALVVMFDAQGVRRASGRQARILNKIMDDIYWQGKIQEGRLREFIGHTPIEVIGGFILGVFIAVIAYK